MRIAAFDDQRIGVVGADDTVIDVTHLLDRYEPLSPADYLPDLIVHFDDLKPELDKRDPGRWRQTARGRQSPFSPHAPIEDRLPDGELPRRYRPTTSESSISSSSRPRASPATATPWSCPRTRPTSFTMKLRSRSSSGEEAKDLEAANAIDAVFGYVAFNDVSARGLGRSGINSFLGKSFDTFAAFGPWIVTKDDIPDPQNLSVTVDVNGERRQDYSTSDMERPIVELLAYISSMTTLHPGDVICCGTNHQGLGSMQDGDEVVTTVSEIGSFAIHVRDTHQRAWQRGVDKETAERVKASAVHPVAAGAGGSN